MWTNRLNALNEKYLFLNGLTREAFRTTKKAQSGTEAAADNALAKAVCPTIPGGIANWFGAIFLEPSRMRQKCPHADTLLVSNLKHVAPGSDLQHMLSNRYVFYGSSLTALGDIVNPPTHTRQPAVHLHAMTFENLVHYGLSYKRRGLTLGNTGWEIGSETVDLILSMAVIFLAVCYLSIHRRGVLIGDMRRGGVAVSRADTPAEMLRRRRALFWSLAGLAAGLYFGAFLLILTAASKPVMACGLVTGTLALFATAEAVFAAWPRPRARADTARRYVLPCFFLLATSGVFVALPALVGGDGRAPRIAAADTALALLIVNALCLLAVLFRRAELAGARSAPENEPRDGLPQGEGWGYLRTLWRNRAAWWLFLIVMTGLLLGLTLALYARVDLSIRNWVGAVLLTFVLGEPLQKFRVEGWIAFANGALAARPRLQRALRLTERAFMTRAEVLNRARLVVPQTETGIVMETR